MLTLRLITIILFSLVITACGGSSKQNNLPIAIASANKLIFTEGENIYLDGSASSDADGDQLTYQWVYTHSGKQHTLKGINPIFKAFEVEPNGATVKIKLTVKDSQNNSSTDNSLTININNVHLSNNFFDNCWIRKNDNTALSGSELFNLKKIYCGLLSSDSLNFQSDIKKLPNIEDISFTGTAEADEHAEDSIAHEFPNLSPLKKLHSISIRGTYNDFTHLESLAQLEELSISGYRKPRFSQLSKLKKLVLHITNKSSSIIEEDFIFDFSALKKLKKLDVHLSGSYSSAIEYKLVGLSELNLLKNLDIRTSMSEKKAIPIDLSGLENLESLYISSPFKLSGLSNLKLLKKISISNPSAVEIYTPTPTATGSTLTDANFSSISNLTNIEELKLSLIGSHFQNLTFENFNKLKKLDLSESRPKYEMPKINGLSNLIININSSDLKQLKYLNLSGINLSEIPNLTHLKNLLSLNIANNKIQELTNISSLKNLVVLHMENNQISTIPSLANLKN